MSASFLLGAGGRLIPANGKPLSLTPGQAPNTGITLTPFILNKTQAADAFFNIGTTAGSNDTLGNVPFIVTYTGGAPTSVYARIMDSSGNPLAGFDWTDITASVHTDSMGLVLGYLNNVPAGVGYKRQIQSGAFTSNDADPFNIGPMILPWGQSNMSKTLYGNGSFNTAIPGTADTELTWYDREKSGAFFGKIGWPGISNNNLVGDFVIDGWGGALHLARTVGTQLKKKFGRKVGIGINPWTQNATAMNGFLTAAPGNVISMLTNSGPNGTAGFGSPATIMPQGDYRLVAWMQGETSEYGQMTRAQRLSDLKRFCQAHIDWVAKFGRSPSQLTFLFCLMGVCDMRSDGSALASHMEILRAAVLDLIADPAVKAAGWDVRIGWCTIDLDPLAGGDGAGLHIQGVDQVRSLRRLEQAAMHVLDTANVPYGAAGPSIQGTTVQIDAVTSIITGNATRSGDTVTITVTHEGGTTLAAKVPGSPITGVYANTAPDFSGTDYAVTNVRFAPGTVAGTSLILLDVVGAPATIYIKFMGGKFYTQQSYQGNNSNWIYDDFTYPTGVNAGEQFGPLASTPTPGLPLNPTPNAIKVG